jgi:hypothetical protein
VQVVYSAKERALPADLTGKTFSRVFNTTAPSLENFILKRVYIAELASSWVT